MADALSLAVNIFTLLEFGRKFALLAWDIQKDGQDAVSRIASLDLTSKDLGKIAGELSQPRLTPAAHTQGQTDERIQKLAVRCNKVAEQMQETINGVGIHRGNSKSGRAVMKAIKLKWKESNIVAFQSEIEDLRSELMLNLILWLRTGMTQSLENQDRMIQEFSEIRRHDAGLKKRLTNLVQEQKGFVQQMVEILSSNATSMVRSHGYNQTQTSQLKTDLMNAMQKSPEQIEGEGESRLIVSPSRLGRVRNQFINTFWYNSMFDREAGVAEAHPGTLMWIFKDLDGETHTWDNFREWLESEDRLYWITGKMGSGKSTMMRYISGNISEDYPARRCTPYLLRWAQGQPLFIATFYFWAGSSGETRIQTSLEGLYRTLLVQILEAYPEAGPSVSPRRWENICLFNENLEQPGIAELKTTLVKAIGYVSSVARICLFIDGLDEFEGENEDLKELITWIKTLVQTAPVKFCVASRPWRVFEDALQDRPHLLMEDFNFKDIQQYVWEKFHGDPNFKNRKRMEPAFCDQISDEIVNKAEGVFLWVRLVCAHLLEAMSRGDLIGDLRRILKALPVQMEELYGHILDSLRPCDKDQAAKYFMLLQALETRPNALTLSFADDVSDDRDFSLEMSQQPLPVAQLHYRVSELGKRLNSRCKGLLSLSWQNDSMSWIVEYCHRSAKDSLTMDYVQEKLNGMLDGPFDPHLRLCSAYSAQWKSCGDNGSGDSRSSCIKCVEHAANVASENCEVMIRVLDDLDLDFKDRKYFDERHFDFEHWFGGNIVSFTVVLGVKEYVRRKIGRGQRCMVESSSVHLSLGNTKPPKWHAAEVHHLINFLAATGGEKVQWPLLLDAFLSANWPNPEMVSLLLENGADPNLIIQGRGREMSALGMVVSRMRGQIDRTRAHEREWVNSVCLLLRYGAKLHRADVDYIRELIGEDEIRNLKLELPHLDHGRRFVSKPFRWLWRQMRKLHK